MKIEEIIFAFILSGMIGFIGLIIVGGTTVILHQMKIGDMYNDKIIEKCIEKNGIPIINDWNKLEDCKF